MDTFTRLCVEFGHERRHEIIQILQTAAQSRKLKSEHRDAMIQIAAKFSGLAASASSSFLRDYYWRLAERYLALEGDWESPGRQGRSISRRGDFSVTDSGRASTS